MEIKLTKNKIKGVEDAFNFFNEKIIGEKRIEEYSYYSSITFNLTVEEIFSEELLNYITILPEFVYVQFWHKILRDELSLDSISREMIIISFKKVISKYVNYYFGLTLTEMRKIFGKYMNFFKTENYMFTEEESDSIINFLKETPSKIGDLNKRFNDRKTMIKQFINCLGTKNIFDLSTDNQIVFKNSYAIETNICPRCGNKAIFGFDQNNEGRFWCGDVGCNNFPSCWNGSKPEELLVTFGIEALQPVRDRVSLFETGEKLLQVKINLELKSGTNFFELVKVMVENYNKGLVCSQGNNLYVITQPYGVKSLKKLISSLEEICVIKSTKTLRVFNINNIENLYTKALEDNTLVVNTGGEIIFDLNTMEVTIIEKEPNYNDCFEPSVDDNSFSLKNCEDKGLLSTLEELKEEE